jgi:energy-coupling factor transport system substrate-specific component
MSWTLASLAIVCLILAAGWITYERRRPSARMAAVVAVMAAMAALGRDAFAALPDVKPITAMALVVGYSLGPLPGFAVGALGMLVSNFMLGQGPYTPWQMAAWGIVGLLGATLGSLSRRRLGRVPIALACAISALIAKEIMNFYQWTLGASHTPAALLAVVGQGVTYDVTDVIASFLFGLAFGPELARVLRRTQVRMQITWTPVPTEQQSVSAPLGAAAVLAALVVGASLLFGAGGVPVARASTQATQARLALGREVSYLAGVQNPDGGFGAAPGQSSSEIYTAWATLGLAAAGSDPLDLHVGTHTVLDVLRGQARSLQGAGDLERTILALHACGVSVRQLPGGDPVKRLLRSREHDGSISHFVNLTAFGVFALRAAGYSSHSATIRAAAGWLAREQDKDGGFGFATAGGGSDVDDTAAVLQALHAAGVSSRGASIARGVAYLLRAQNPDGGYPQQIGGSSNAQSTAWAIQGLIAAGREVGAVRRQGSRTPVEYLESLVQSDGSVRYSRTGEQTPVWVTAQALTALAGKPFPIAAVPRSSASSASEFKRATIAVKRLLGLALAPIAW